MLYHPNPDRLLITPDGSHIMEMLGRVTTGENNYSVAHITMPAGPGQPRRQNGFHELMLVVDGTCEVALQNETLQLRAGDVLDLPPNTPYAERGGPDGCTLWAICWPAFNPELVTWLNED